MVAVVTKNLKLLSTIKQLEAEAELLCHQGLARKLNDTQKILRTEIQVKEDAKEVFTFAVTGGRLYF